MLAYDLELRMSGTSGRTSQVPFAFYDPESSSWRTYGDTLDGDSLPFSGTLPTSGSMRNGELFEHQTSAHRTSVSGCSSPPLLKTPTAQLAANGGSQHPDKRRAGGHGPTLADEVEHLLPTPRARDGKGRDPNPRGVDLNEAVALLPTPRATDGTNGGPNQRGSSGDLMLPSAVHRLLPTPTATDAKSSSGANPAWGHGVTLTDAARSTGAPTSPPFVAGNTSPAAPPPGQLSLGEPESA
jgi:hypothetical protein